MNNIIYTIEGTNESYACGFFADGFFITAGHVIKELEKPTVRICGKTYSLEDPVRLFADDDSTGYDLAVFYIASNILVENLEFTECNIQKGTVLDCKGFIQETVKDDNSPNNGHTVCKPFSCTAIVKDTNIDNYFSVLTSTNLESGCSGAPLFMNNNVAGIIVAGNNNGDNTPKDNTKPINYCIVLSSNAIMQVVSKIYT